MSSQVVADDGERVEREKWALVGRRKCQNLIGRISWILSAVPRAATSRPQR